MTALLDWETMSREEKEASKMISEHSPLAFMRVFFQINQGMKFLCNWHHRYMDYTAQQVLQGKLKNVVFNMPPGGTKTEYWSIHLPAYVMTKFDRTRNLSVSYSKSLVEENSNRIKSIITSSEYQELWPCSLGKADVANWIVTDDNGRNKHQIFSRSTGGQITGVRGGYISEGFSGFINLDDPEKADSAFSATMRAKAQRIVVNTLRSRRASPDTPVICTQQRLHTDDVSGFLLAGGMGLDFSHIKVPALVTREYIESLPREIREHAERDVFSGPSVVRGGVEYWSYWPAKESVFDLMALWDRDAYTLVSQYQQSPIALTGGMIDADWFPTYEQLPFLVWRGVYVDTAQKTDEQHDFSVFSHCGLGIDGNLYIIEIVRGKWDAGDLEAEALKVWQRWQPWDNFRPATLRYMRVEDKSSGTGLIQTISKKGSIQIQPQPRGPASNKVVRCMDAVPWFKSGRVFVPAIYDEHGNKIDQVKDHRGVAIAPADWVPTFLTEASAFTADDTHDHDDQIDTIFDAVADMLISGGGDFFSSNWLS
jgi:predicted phage terminase large subunit-like protein